MKNKTKKTLLILLLVSLLGITGYCSFKDVSDDYYINKGREFCNKTAVPDLCDCYLYSIYIYKGKTGYKHFVDMLYNKSGFEAIIDYLNIDRRSEKIMNEYIESCLNNKNK